MKHDTRNEIVKNSAHCEIGREKALFSRREETKIR
jgi:hypothetical protein